MFSFIGAPVAHCSLWCHSVNSAWSRYEHGCPTGTLSPHCHHQQDCTTRCCNTSAVWNAPQTDAWLMLCMSILGFRSPRDGTGNQQCCPYGITGTHRQIPGEILKKDSGFFLSTFIGLFKCFPWCVLVRVRITQRPSVDQRVRAKQTFCPLDVSNDSTSLYFNRK